MLGEILTIENQRFVLPVLSFLHLDTKVLSTEGNGENGAERFAQVTRFDVT